MNYYRKRNTKFVIAKWIVYLIFGTAAVWCFFYYPVTVVSALFLIFIFSFKFDQMFNERRWFAREIYYAIEKAFHHRKSEKKRLFSLRTAYIFSVLSSCLLLMANPQYFMQ